ncbi:unnamed protein product [Schistosoma mattheei]|uniref:Uncharacterized protein n=1 Tax=Schistosoma mattheei TaxID=31246 RepID=A0AA85B2N8_9TREM|nr:unnamed protein product [Schistosoma mattheei]
MKGGFQPLLSISRSYYPIVIRNPDRMSRIAIRISSLLYAPDGRRTCNSHNLQKAFKGVQGSRNSEIMG